MQQTLGRIVVAMVVEPAEAGTGGEEEITEETGFELSNVPPIMAVD